MQYVSWADELMNECKWRHASARQYLAFLESRASDLAARQAGIEVAASELCVDVHAL
jgi:hypothetical protein